VGFGAFDALHLACAESAGAEVLLTTDDRLRSRAAREKTRLAVQVENPAKWYSEAIAP
jgi:predicted nucleic acid-binding protein